jgi:hypothetical protein
MKLVIQCAGSKDPRAGHLSTKDGRPVAFVANPNACAPNAAVLYARPDDPSDVSGLTWRDRLVRENPVGLLPAWRLYTPPAYAALVEKYGEKDVFILSAGWGLVRADFPLPDYDITFLPSADECVKRRKGDRYADFQQLVAGAAESIIFFGGKAYLPLFSALTADTASERIVFYNSGTVPVASGCRLVRYETRRLTNWHYSCVEDFVAGRIPLEGSKI